MKIYSQAGTHFWGVVAGFKVQRSGFPGLGSFGFASGIFGFNGLKRGEKWLNLASIWVRFGFVFLRNPIKTGIVWLRFFKKTFF
jgi:hypothetical protein